MLFGSMCECKAVEKWKGKTNRGIKQNKTNKKVKQKELLKGSMSKSV